MAFITFTKGQILRVVEKSDVYIVYTNESEKPWVCDKQFKPEQNKDGSTKYKLAER